MGFVTMGGCEDAWIGGCDNGWMLQWMTTPDEPTLSQNDRPTMCMNVYNFILTGRQYISKGWHKPAKRKMMTRKAMTRTLG